MNERIRGKKMRRAERRAPESTPYSRLAEGIMNPAAKKEAAAALKPGDGAVAYSVIIDEIVEVHLEKLCDVKAHPSAYLSALRQAQDRIDEWLEASIEAAKNDVARAG